MEGLWWPLAFYLLIVFLSWKMFREAWKESAGDFAYPEEPHWMRSLYFRVHLALTFVSIVYGLYLYLVFPNRYWLGLMAVIPTILTTVLVCRDYRRRRLERKALETRLRDCWDWPGDGSD